MRTAAKIMQAPANTRPEIGAPTMLEQATAVMNRATPWACSRRRNQ